MKIENVRENISSLIDEIVDLRKERDSGYCCDVYSMENNICDGECNKCKNIHYENMREYLNNKYNV